MLGEHHNLIALHLSVRTVIRLILLYIVHISGLCTPSLRRDPRKCTPYSVRCAAPDGRGHANQRFSRSACLVITGDFGVLASPYLFRPSPGERFRPLDTFSILTGYPGICVRDISGRLPLSDLTRGVQSAQDVILCCSRFRGYVMRFYRTAGAAGNSASMSLKRG